MLDLEGFEIVGKLGSGGMATVWRARQMSLDREVAIKELSSRFASAPEDVARFQAEACTAGRLKHPGIVQVYDAFFRNGAYCFVMELVNGYTVGDWVRRKGRLSERTALDIAECLAVALEYAWNQFGMVHCDIKPDNVMIDEDGTVKLTDLGLSRTVRTLEERSEQEQEVFGTPAYVSPEQAMGEPDLDCRADMYSLGAMLYHLVTGRMLFQGEAEEQVMELQVSGTVENPRRIVPTLSLPFCDLLEKLLAKDRRHRHADWQQVRADLVSVRLRRPLASGFPHPHASTIETDEERAAALSDHVSAVLRGTAPRASNAKASAVAAAVAATVALAVVGGFAFVLARSDRPQTSAQPPQRQASRRGPVSRAEALLAEAEDWASHNVGRNAEIVARYRRVLEAAPSSPEAALARAAITRIEERIAERCEEVLRTLQARSAHLLEAGDFDQAIAAYKTYAGPYARETDQRRRQRIEELLALRQEQQLREQVEAAEREAQSRREEAVAARREQGAGMMEALLDILDRDGIAAAVAGADPLTDQYPLAMQDHRVRTLRTILLDAAAAERAVLQSFADQIGETIELRTRSGSITGRINRIDWTTGDLHIGRSMGSAVVEVTVVQRDLPLAERIRRMGADESPGVRLAKALVSIEYGAFAFAREQLEPLPRALRERMLVRIPDGR